MKQISFHSPLTLIASFSFLLFLLYCQLPKQKQETLTSWPGVGKTYHYSKQITEIKNLLRRNYIYPKDLNLPSAHLTAAITATERWGNHIVLPKSFYHKYKSAINGNVIQDGKLAQLVMIQTPDLDNQTINNDEVILELEEEFAKLSFDQDQLEEVMAVLYKQIKTPSSDIVSKQEWEKIEIGALEGYVSKLFESTIIQQETWEDSFKPQTSISISIPIKESKTKRKIITKLKKTSFLNKIGLQTDDEILSINGNSVRFISIPTIEQMLKGKVGESIKITILRNKNQIHHYEIPLKTNGTSITNENKSIEAKIQTGKYNFIHMKVLGFVKGIDFDSIKLIKENYTSLMEEAKSKKITIHGFLLDLRDNSGGYLDLVTECMRLFVTKGLLYTTRAPNNEYYANNSVLIELPLIVLINEDTGSGSELIAGVVRYHNRGAIFGTKSFGHGLVHTLRSVPGSATLLIKYPTSFLYLPNGEKFHNIGISPDLWISEEANESPRYSKPISKLNENGEGTNNGNLPNSKLDLQKIGQWVEKNGSAKQIIQTELQKGQTPDYQLLHSLDAFAGILATQN
ncbi:peptidase [Leptospira biflexa]|uniref:S41 family peptidase n=1 Tax=Leptospira biflexa TaxID=172 RepID=UPI0010839D1E|nr:S41 family peptidase [Leptospira biflexa]TGM32079.1 peptidase [Leptospira biflexa]TGM42057.1 peptidase [Leptospira biflexa]TGM42828.1 peptidase [Leptospira biflexa]TGM45906.1 peptidase [Leptospira biflexa]